jgi:hypothetical protein
MSAKLKRGDRVLVEAVVAGVIWDGTLGLTIKNIGPDGAGTFELWDVPNDIVHFLEAGAE